MTHVPVMAVAGPPNASWEKVERANDSCPVCASAEVTREPVIMLRWLRFPRLQRQTGLATGIIGLW